MNLITHWLFAVLLLSSSVLAACQGYDPMSPLLVAEKVLLNGNSGLSTPAVVASPTTSPATPTLTPAAMAPATPAATSAATGAAAFGTAQAASVVDGGPDSGPPGGIVAAATTADYSPTMPVALAIPAVGLQAQVTPMGWETALIDDQVTTRWVVPEQTLGWAVNSAGAGEAGNVIIVGHQALGAALFRPLALGEVTVGQEIQLQASDGTTHLYRVVEVSAPITAIGATADELVQAAAYLAPAAIARLTLVSGWPADATTHRLFVVAEYTGASVGVQP